MTDKVKKEVDDMLDDFFPGEEKEESTEELVEESTEEKEESVEEKKDESVEEKEESTEKKEELVEKKEELVEEKEELAEEKEETSEETAEEETARLREQNRLLLERIEKGYEPPEVTPKEEPPKEELPPKEEPPKKEVKPPEPIDFVGDKTLEEVLDSKEGLNAFLNRVVSTIAPKDDLDMEPIVERILTALPKIVQTQVTQQTAINELVKDFYDNNKDLQVARRTVATLANEVHAENPDWETKKVFEEAGVRTRKALGLREKAIGTERKERGPAFTRTRGSRKGGEKDTRTELAKDIDDLVE